MKLSQITEVRKPKITPQAIEKNYGPAVNLALSTVTSRVKRAFSREQVSSSDIRGAESRMLRGSIEWMAEMRFSTNGEVWDARSGEEDDDHPEANQKAFKEMDKILQDEAKKLSQRIKIPVDKNVKFPKGPAKGKLRALIGGEEKGWVTFSIEIGI